MANLIKSPLNYTGNKYRILSQIMPYFPQKVGTMVDLFCGGATVGLNVECEKIIFVDNDEKVINLLKYFAEISFETLLTELEQIISKYGLSYSHKFGYRKYKDTIKNDNANNGLKQYNSKGFYLLRDDYNALKDKKTAKANQMLYMLMVYGFNNDIRFSKENHYNLPVGKTDLNSSNIKKLKEYIERIGKIKAEFVYADFESEQVKGIIKTADFIYLDPPYLITTAVYNETNKWNEDKEYALLGLIEKLCEMKKKFVLSNVLTKNIKGTIKRNEPLFYWTTVNKGKLEFEIVDIDYHYRSASYNKKNRDAKEREVIIIPKR
jgi:DNA adenine methylase Dam